MSESLGNSLIIACPWCHQPNDLWFEFDVNGDLVQDCEVCCRPWAITVHAGTVVHVERAQ